MQGDCKTCENYWQRRFGKNLTDDIFDKIALKLYGHRSSELDPSASYITKLDRVCLFTEDMMRIFEDCEDVRTVIAYPNQLGMPNYRKNNQRGLYPKKGMKYLTKKLVENLEAKGVKILYQSSRWNKRVSGKQKYFDENPYELSCTNQNSEHNRNFCINTDKLVWTGPLKELIKVATKINKKEERKEKRVYKSSVDFSCFIYFQLPRDEHNLDELYYAYFYDQQTSPFRITNLTSYSGNTYCNSDKMDMLCAEYHINEGNIGNLSTLPSNDLKKFTEKEITLFKEMGIFNHSAAPNFDGFIIPKRVFPVPLASENFGVNVKDTIFSNILYNGKETRKTNFFLVDTLRSLHTQLNE